MPFVKVARSNEEDAKGVKPIVVTFEKLTVGFHSHYKCTFYSRTYLLLGPKRCVAKIKISERKFNRYQRGFPARYYAEKTALNQVCETGQIMFPNVLQSSIMNSQNKTVCLSSGA